ncbi:hypothetical protein IJ182_07495 [bacterium]|nr:hypothetical protein [bacterium]
MDIEKSIDGFTAEELSQLYDEIIEKSDFIAACTCHSGDVMGICYGTRCECKSYSYQNHSSSYNPGVYVYFVDCNK